MKPFHFFQRRCGLPLAQSMPVTGVTEITAPKVPVLLLWIAVYAIAISLMAVLLVYTWSLAFALYNAAPAWLLLLLPVAGVITAYVIRQRDKAGAGAMQFLYIFTGMPLGFEGGLFGLSSGVANAGFTQISRKELLLWCNMTAALAALFGTPLAAVAAFAGNGRKHIPYLLLAAVIGGLIHYTFYPAAVKTTGRLPGLAATGLYILLGAGVGLIAGLHTRVMLWLQGAYDKQGSFAWQLAAGVITGAVVWYRPAAFGAGLPQLEKLVSVENITLLLIITMGGYKLITFIAAAGSRIPGGYVMPLAVTGAAFGILAAFGLQVSFKSVALDPAIAAAVGMAAMLAGSTRLLIMAILFALEYSLNPAATIPVLTGAAAAWMTSAFFLRREAVVSR